MMNADFLIAYLKRDPGKVKRETLLNAVLQDFSALMVHKSVNKKKMIVEKLSAKTERETKE